MFYTDDPIADYERYSAQQEAELDRLPRCSECDQPIQEEYAYYINGEWICESCMNSYYRKEVVPDGCV